MLDQRPIFHAHLGTLTQVRRRRLALTN